MLTDTLIRKTRPQDKPYKLYDADGLYLVVRPSGGKSWLFRYQLNHVRKDESLGRYPAVSLREARTIAADAQLSLMRKIDPFIEEKINTPFSEVTNSFLQKKEQAVKTSYFKTISLRFHKYILPPLGKFSIHSITTDHICDLLITIDNSGRNETARRVHQLIGEVFRFAILNGFADYDPSQSLKGLIIPVKKKHFPYIRDKQTLGQVLRAIDNSPSNIATVYALKILPHVFVRPNEIRFATWQEFDLESAVWKIPAQRMKMGREHWIPLSRQVVQYLQELHAFTGSFQWVFEGVRRGHHHSENTLNYALKSLGFGSDIIVPHGFRATASTFLHEMGFDHLIIEKQLAHEQKNRVSAAYNHAQYLDQRRKMMQQWSDFLDEIKEKPAPIQHSVQI